MTHNLHTTADRLRESVAGIIAQADAYDDLAAAITRFEEVTKRTVVVEVKPSAEQKDAPPRPDAAPEARSASVAAMDDIRAANVRPKDDAPVGCQPEAAGGHGDPWTEQQLQRLIDLRAGGYYWSHIAKAMKRSADACRIKYRELVVEGRA